MLDTMQEALLDWITHAQQELQDAIDYLERTKSLLGLSSAPIPGTAGKLSELAGVRVDGNQKPSPLMELTTDYSRLIFSLTPGELEDILDSCSTLIRILGLHGKSIKTQGTPGGPGRVSPETQASFQH